MKSNISNIRVVLIDKGSLTFLERDSILFRYKMSEKFDINEQIVRDDSFSLDHGDICAAIIKKYCNAASIGIIDIFENGNRLSSSEKLIKALEYCNENEVDIVHLSIGSTRFKDFYTIRNVISSLHNTGKIIISAGSNKNIFTVPAGLEGVIGVVKTDIAENNQIIYNYHNFNRIAFKARGQHNLCHNYITDSSNSFAAAVVTAKVCNVLSRNPQYKFNEIYQKLVRSSINYITGQNIWLTKYDDCDIYNKNSKYEFDRNYCAINELKVPVVILYNLTNEILLEIKNEFLLNDYNCLAISSVMHNDYLEIEYLKTNDIYIAYKRLLAISISYEPDLVLLYLDKHFAIDFSEVYNLEYMLDISKLLKLAVNNRKYDIKNLYKKLLEMLGGSEYEEKGI